MSTIFAIGRSAALCNLGPVERIPLGEGREYEVAGETIAVFRERHGGLYAVQAQCPHRAGPLADGIAGAGQVICPLHAFKFELATGKPLGHECAPLKTFSVKLNAEGEILLTISNERTNGKKYCAAGSAHE